MPNTHRLIDTQICNLNSQPAKHVVTGMYTPPRSHTDTSACAVGECTSTCVGVEGYSRGAKSSFLWEAPLMQCWPHPWPSPPRIWQGLICLIFHLAEGENKSTGLHTCTQTHTCIFQDLIYLFPPLSPPSSSLFLLIPFALVEARSLLSWCKHTNAHTHHRTAVWQWSVEWISATSKCSRNDRAFYGSHMPCL